MKMWKAMVCACVATASTLTVRAEDGVADWHLIVSKDRTRTAVRMADGKVTDVKLGGGELAPMPNMAGSTRAVAHALSPDRKRIVYEMEPDGKSESHFIALADADGKNFRPLSAEKNTRHPAWSVDGQSIAVLAQSEASKGAWHVYRIDADNGDIKQMSRQPVPRTRRPCFAADGRLIYQIDRGRDGKMQLMDLVIGDANRETTLMQKTFIIAAATSQDGQRLAVLVPDEMSIHELTTGEIRKFSMKDVNPVWQVTFSDLLWRSDNRALAIQFGFLGGMQRGARIEGDDHVAVMSFEAAKPAMTTYRVGGDQRLYAWVTGEDMKRKK